LKSRRAAANTALEFNFDRELQMNPNESSAYRRRRSLNVRSNNLHDRYLPSQPLATLACDTMPTQKDVLMDRLHDTINKKAGKSAKNPPATPKSKAQSGKARKENKASKSVKSATPGKRVVTKKEKKPPSIL